MIVSLRTLVNTTLFWILLVLGFWAYTKYDPTPAKDLLHFIGWDQLGNITATADNNSTTPMIESLSNQLIAERLHNIEQICSKSIRLSIYDQTPIIQPSSYPANFTPSTLTTDTISTISGTIVSPILIENNIIPQSSGSRL